MNTKLKIYNFAVILLSAAIVLALINLWYKTAMPAAAQTADIIKWVDFEIPAGAMKKAIDIDVASYSGDNIHIDWLEILAILGTKYGGDWNLYKSKDMDGIIKKMETGETHEEILKGYKNYDYFYTIYGSVLGEFLGEYQKDVPDRDNPDRTTLEERYGLKVYHPIAEGYGYSHYRDFGASRTYGYNRGHTGNDLCGSVGTPIVAVEAGTVEELGWNRYGGWRIGIRSFDKKRYYYYAHLRKGHPYAPDIKIGSEVQGGDVIGYMGMTGYSTKEDVNNMKIPHLHFGMQLIFDESQKDGNAQIWIDVYDIIELLERNRTTVTRIGETKDYVRKYKMYDEHFPCED